MMYPPAAFVLRFLELNFVHKVSICTNANGNDDIFNEWKSVTTASLAKFHLVNALPVEDIVKSLNWPSKEETMLIICPTFEWSKSYPEWSYEKNVAWLTPDDPLRDNDEWSDNLRLDSRFFTYSAQQDDIKVQELYRIKKGPILRQDYGVWNETENALSVPEPALWERRTNLQGAEIVDSILEWKPFIIMDPEGDFARTTGIHVDMLTELQRALNFTVKKYSPADGQWGFLKEINETTSVMTGMVGDLVAKKADLSTAGLYITKERQVYTDMVASVSDFTTLIMPASLASASAQIDTLAYVQIFSGSTWLLMLAIGVAVVALFAVTVSFLNNAASVMRSMSEGLQVSYLTMIQIGVRVSLDTTTKRIIFLTSSMVAFVAYSYYCSDLTALMTHRPPPVTIRNFQVILLLRNI